MRPGEQRASTDCLQADGGWSDRNSHRQNAMCAERPPSNYGAGENRLQAMGNFFESASRQCATCSKSRPGKVQLARNRLQAKCDLLGNTSRQCVTCAKLPPSRARLVGGSSPGRLKHMQINDIFWGYLQNVYKTAGGILQRGGYKNCLEAWPDSSRRRRVPPGGAGCLQASPDAPDGSVTV